MRKKANNLMRQEEWRIKTNDHHNIYGVTDYALEDKSSQKCLILVHGLSGGANEYHIKSAANFFVAKGYDVIRFNLYYWDKGARQLSECTLQTHALDLNTVISNKANTYPKLFLSGHSYGGPTIMVAQPKIATALSLWDPSFDLPNVFSKNDFDRTHDLNIWRTGVEKILGDDFVEEITSRYNQQECLELSESLSTVPIQVIAAGGEDAIYWKDKYSWHSAGHKLNERRIIKDADHCFFRKNTLQDVLDYSHAWFEKF